MPIPLYNVETGEVRNAPVTMRKALFITMRIFCGEASAEADAIRPYSSLKNIRELITFVNKLFWSAEKYEGK